MGQSVIFYFSSNWLLSQISMIVNLLKDMRSNLVDKIPSRYELTFRLALFKVVALRIVWLKLKLVLVTLSASE